MTAFQSVVNTNPALGVEGDFASANPRASMLAGDGSFVAASVGVIVGRFARARNSDGTVTNEATAAASRIGFVHRDQPAIITDFLGGATLLVPEGQPVTLFDGGDFWARFAGGATIGQKVYAGYADGAAIADDANKVSPGAVATGNIANGSPTLTITGVTSGSFAIGEPVTIAGVPAGTTIIAFGTGTGGVGTYTLSANATATTVGVAVTTAGAKETQWYVHSAAGAGELAKISTRPIS